MLWFYLSEIWCNDKLKNYFKSNHSTETGSVAYGKAQFVRESDYHIQVFTTYNNSFVSTLFSDKFRSSGCLRHCVWMMPAECTVQCVQVQLVRPNAIITLINCCKLIDYSALWKTKPFVPFISCLAFHTIDVLIVQQLMSGYWFMVVYQYINNWGQ
jgi:hypothetical protein